MRMPSSHTIFWYFFCQKDAHNQLRYIEHLFRNHEPETWANYLLSRNRKGHIRRNRRMKMHLRPRLSKSISSHRSQLLRRPQIRTANKRKLKNVQLLLHIKETIDAMATTDALSANVSGSPVTPGRIWRKNASDAALWSTHTNRCVSEGKISSQAIKTVNFLFNRKSFWKMTTRKTIVESILNTCARSAKPLGTNALS